MCDVLKQRFVLLAQGDPIETMHVWHVEEIPVPPPDFIEDLVPFLGRNAIDD